MITLLLLTILATTPDGLPPQADSGLPPRAASIPTPKQVSVAAPRAAVVPNRETSTGKPAAARPADGSVFPLPAYRVPSGRDANGDVSFPSAFRKHGAPDGALLNRDGERVRFVEPNASGLNAALPETCLCDECACANCRCRLCVAEKVPAVVALDFKPEPKASPADDRQWYPLGGAYSGFHGYGRKQPDGSILVEWNCQAGTADVRRGLPTMAPQPSSPAYQFAAPTCPNRQCGAQSYTRCPGFFGFRGR